MLMVAKVAKRTAPFCSPALSPALVAGKPPHGCSPSPGWWGGLLCELCLRAGQFRRKSWLVLGFFCFNLGIHRRLPAPVVHQGELSGVCRPDDGRRLHGYHGGPADLAGVRESSCSRHPWAGSILGALLGMKLHGAGTSSRPGWRNEARGLPRGSFLDPRTKILIWLLANVVGCSPGLRRCSGTAVMLRLLRPLPAGAEGENACGPAAGLPGHRGGAVLAAAAAARLSCHGLCHSDLFHPSLSLHCRRGLTSLPPPASASSWPPWSGWGRPGAFPSRWR